MANTRHRIYSAGLTIIMVVIVSWLFNSCSEAFNQLGDTCSDYSENSLKDYFYFEEGSKWVYQTSDSIPSETLNVIHSWLQYEGNESNDGACSCYKWYSVTIKQSNLNTKWVFNNNCRSRGFEIFANNGDDFIEIKDSDSIINKYSIGSVTFENVIYKKHQTYQSGVVEFFIAPYVGIIEYREGDRVWTLAP